MPAHAISVSELSKRYHIAHERKPYGRLTEELWDAIRAPLESLQKRRASDDGEWFWALKDVSFDVAQGDVFGIVGRNGAGKTTLLKVLSRITEPTTGQAILRGRVGSLLEVGTGFHPELTGRENVFLSGSILGMKRREIVQQFDEIVAFAEVERFLDTPVKRYSSGMQVRLGFAVAAHLDTEILIVDEVLAVGDAAFQKKCLAKMENEAQSGRTILFVSHNMAAIEHLCTSAVLLDGGSIVLRGSVHEVVNRYLESSLELGSTAILDRRDRQGDGRMRIVAVESSVRTGSLSELRFHYAAQPGVKNVAISVGLFTSRGEGAVYLATELSGQDLPEIPATGALVCRFDHAGLLPGRYSMNIYCTVNGVVADWVIDAATIDVAEGDFYGTGKLPPPGYGSVAVQQGWAVEPE